MPRSPRRGRLLTVVAVLVLGLVGLGGAPAGATATPPRRHGRHHVRRGCCRSGAEAAAAASGGLFTSLRPSRLLDTRPGWARRPPRSAPARRVHLQVGGRGGVPSTGVAAVVLNVTVTEPSRHGHVTVYGDGTALPERVEPQLQGGADGAQPRRHPGRQQRQGGPVQRVRRFHPPRRRRRGLLPRGRRHRARLVPVADARARPRHPLGCRRTGREGRARTRTVHLQVGGAGACRHPACRPSS